MIAAEQLSPEALARILDLHLNRWIRGKPDGARANLEGAYLGGAYLVSQHIVQIAPIGSRSAYLSYRWGHDHTGAAVDEARTGCFTGTLAALEQAVEQTHGDNVHGRAYKAAIALLRVLSVAQAEVAA